jgi:hypothetical protein
MSTKKLRFSFYAPNAIAEKLNRFKKTHDIASDSEALIHIVDSYFNSIEDGFTLETLRSRIENIEIQLGFMEQKLNEKQ